MDANARRPLGWRVASFVIPISCAFVFVLLIFGLPCTTYWFPGDDYLCNPWSEFALLNHGFLRVWIGILLVAAAAGVSGWIGWGHSMVWARVLCVIALSLLVIAPLVAWLLGDDSGRTLDGFLPEATPPLAIAIFSIVSGTRRFDAAVIVALLIALVSIVGGAWSALFVLSMMTSPFFGGGSLTSSDYLQWGLLAVALVGPGLAGLAGSIVVAVRKIRS